PRALPGVAWYAADSRKSGAAAHDESGRIAQWNRVGGIECFRGVAQEYSSVAVEVADHAVIALGRSAFVLEPQSHVQCQPAVDTPRVLHESAVIRRIGRIGRLPRGN